MTKYARKREGCWIDVFRVPEDFPDLATLNRCLPFGDFVAVDDALKAGDFTDGTESGFTERPPPPVVVIPKSPMKLSATDLEAWLISKLGNISAIQTLLKKCAANTDTDDNGLAVQYFPTWYARTQEVTKADFTARATPLTLTTPAIVTANALSNALASWPEA